MMALANGDRLMLEDLRKIEQKVCIAVGDKDHMVSREESKEVADCLANSERIILEDWPHPLEKNGSAQIAVFYLEEFKVTLMSEGSLYGRHQNKGILDQSL